MSDTRLLFKPETTDAFLHSETRMEFYNTVQIPCAAVERRPGTFLCRPLFPDAQSLDNGPVPRNILIL
jgi:hypothetical protein